MAQEDLKKYESSFVNSFGPTLTNFCLEPVFTRIVLANLLLHFKSPESSQVVKGSTSKDRCNITWERRRHPVQNKCSNNTVRFICTKTTCLDNRTLVRLSFHKKNAFFSNTNTLCSAKKVHSNNLFSTKKVNSNNLFSTKKSELK